MHDGLPVAHVAKVYASNLRVPAPPASKPGQVLPMVHDVGIPSRVNLTVWSPVVDVKAPPDGGAVLSSVVEIVIGGAPVTIRILRTCASAPPAKLIVITKSIVSGHSASALSLKVNGTLFTATPAGAVIAG